MRKMNGRRGRGYCGAGLVLCAAAALNATGCIQHAEAPRRSLWIRAVDAEDHPVGKFVFVRMTRTEALHQVDDPHDHWNPPEITHMLLSDAGKCTMMEPATTNVEGVLFAPKVGFKRQTEVCYRVYAKGYEVWRENSAATPVSQLGTENPATLTFTLVKTPGAARIERARPASSDTSAAMLMPPVDSGRGAAGDVQTVLDDLQDDGFWKQVEGQWESSGNRQAIRFVCEYYIERLRGFSQDNPGWGVPANLSERVTWMRGAAGSGL